MRPYLLYFAIALIPTALSSATIPSNSAYALTGIWLDQRSDTELEIRSHRRGIKVRRNGKRWRTYYKMGGGVYDDCNGSAIAYLGRGEIIYRRNRRRPIYLSRYDLRGTRRYNNDGFGDRVPDYRYRDRYRGDWYCDDHGLRLTIETYGNGGIRARHGRDNWVYYDRYNNNRFLDSRGNGYYFDGDILIWTSNNGRRKYRFRKW